MAEYHSCAFSRRPAGPRAALALLFAGLLLIPAAAQTTQPTTQPAGIASITDWVRQAQVETGKVPDPADRNAAQWEVVRLCARAGDEASALEIGKLIPVQPHNWYLQEVVAVEQARRGDFAKAVKTADDIVSTARRADTIMQIIQAQSLAKDFKAAQALADTLESQSLQARAYGEIAAGQALAGDFAAARATAGSEIITRQRDRKAAVKMRDRILSVVAEMQALAGDEAGARDTAADIKDDMVRSWAEQTVQDSRAEAAFQKAWRALPGTSRWPMPPATILDPGLRGMLFESLTAAVVARSEEEYEKAIAASAGIASRIILDDRLAPRTRDGRPMPVQHDPTIMQRGLAYTLIAAVEAARNDITGARAMVVRAISTGEQEAKNDLFTGTCGPVLAAMLVKLNSPDLAMGYALKLQTGHPHGEQVARAVGYTLAEQNMARELADYMSKLENPTHRAQACLGVVSWLIDARKK